MVTVHIGNALDFFRVILFLFLFICRFSCIDIYLHVLFFIGLNHLRSKIWVNWWRVRNRKQAVVQVMVFNLKLL